MKTITQPQFAEILRGITHALPISFSALVDARARKTGNPFGEIRKISRVQAFTGFDYENSVNRQLDREGKTQLEFTAKERSWGQRISPALVEKDGKLYLVAKIQRADKPVYLHKSKQGFWKVISKELIAAFLPAFKPATNQGTEKEIVYRNYSLENIVSLSMNGERYRVRETVSA